MQLQNFLDLMRQLIENTLQYKILLTWVWAFLTHVSWAMVFISCFSWILLYYVVVLLLMGMPPGLMNTVITKMVPMFQKLNLYTLNKWNESAFPPSLNTLDHAKIKLLIYDVEWISILGNDLIFSNHLLNIAGVFLYVGMRMSSFFCLQLSPVFSFLF